jgi:hypothetical protein
MTAAVWIPLALCGVGVTAFTIVGALAYKAFGGARQ